MDSNALKKKFICGFHFNPEQCLGKFLPKSAVPVKYSKDLELNNDNITEAIANVPGTSKIYQKTDDNNLEVKIRQTGEHHILTPAKKRRTTYFTCFYR